MPAPTLTAAGAVVLFLGFTTLAALTVHVLAERRAARLRWRALGPAASPLQHTLIADASRLSAEAHRIAVTLAAPTALAAVALFVLTGV